jgi:hypothetical protein
LISICWLLPSAKPSIANRSRDHCAQFTIANWFHFHNPDRVSPHSTIPLARPHHCNLLRRQARLEKTKNKSPCNVWIDQNCPKFILREIGTYPLPPSPPFE